MFRAAGHARAAARSYDDGEILRAGVSLAYRGSRRTEAPLSRRSWFDRSNFAACGRAASGFIAPPDARASVSSASGVNSTKRLTAKWSRRA